MTSIEDLCEHLSNSIVFGKGLRKTAARMPSFLSEAVSGKERPRRRPGRLKEKEPLSACTVWGINVAVF